VNRGGRLKISEVVELRALAVQPDAQRRTIYAADHGLPRFPGGDTERDHAGGHGAVGDEPYADGVELLRYDGQAFPMPRAAGISTPDALNGATVCVEKGTNHERNLGHGSALGLERGLNHLWTRGGLMYAPPID